MSPGCQHCYAESFAKRTGNDVWGKNSDRRRFGDKHWDEPVRWDADAAKAGRPALTFCASMADVFEDRDDHLDDRGRLFGLIETTPHLIWQLLTKRPENVLSMVPPRWRFEQWPGNAWIGTTVEDQERADERIPELLAVPAPVRFLSCEPLLGPIDLGPLPAIQGVDWLIIGGESGGGHRTLNLDDARLLRDQAETHGIPWFFKQVGGQFAHSGGDRLDGVRHKAFPPSAQRETVHEIADPWVVGRGAAGQAHPTPL